MRGLLAAMVDYYCIIFLPIVILLNWSDHVDAFLSVRELVHHHDGRMTAANGGSRSTHFWNHDVSNHQHGLEAAVAGGGGGGTIGSSSSLSLSPARHPKQSKPRKGGSSTHHPHQRQRRPKYYWTEVSNVELALRELWESKEVAIDAYHHLPPIPNESLLNYWNRHDLRGAIITHGGRTLLSERMGNAPIIPGKWNEAVQTWYVQQILQHDRDLSADTPPLSPQRLQQEQKQQLQQQRQRQHEEEATKDVLQSGEKCSDNNNEVLVSRPSRWSHSSHRKPKGYWSSMTVVVEEMYRFLEDRRRAENIPESWMPRLSELEQAGRMDLATAIQRFGGTQVLCTKAGLIPFREWNYVEGMYELLLKMKEYLDEYHDGDYRTFPIASHLKERGKERLYFLIQYYGGVKFLAARLDMECRGTKNMRQRNTSQLLSADMNWGPFGLEFGIELYSICREQQLRKKPPLLVPEIRIPTRRELSVYGERGERVTTKILEYGGYENVARRLGLGFTYGLF